MHDASAASPRDRRPDSSTVVNNAAFTEPPSTSLELQLAVHTIACTKNNLTIDACAGAGKTTIILLLAQAASQDQFLMLVYNTRLMIETQQRVEALGIHNLTVLNYHAYGSRYYTTECANDEGLKRVVEDDMPVKSGMQLPSFSVLVMDEQQDMTPIMKRFVDKTIRDGELSMVDQKSAPRLVVVGDTRQLMYSFNNADHRFLTHASHPNILGKVNGNDWTSINLRTSKRITTQIMRFINEQMLRLPSELALKSEKTFNKYGGDIPDPLVQSHGIDPSDIMVLAPSVRSMTPAIQLGNALACARIPVCRHDSERSDVSPASARGKILICTYHQAKGIERKAVLVLGFDSNYHLWYDRRSRSPTSATNPMYVAVTRALEHLVLIQNYEAGPLPYINLQSIGCSCEVDHLRSQQPAAAVNIQDVTPIRPLLLLNVALVCRQLSDCITTDALQHICIHKLSEPAYGLTPPPPTEVTDKHGLLEGVSAITGTAIPAIYQWQKKKGLAVLESAKQVLKRSPKLPRALRTLPSEIYRQLEMAVDRYKEHRLDQSHTLFFSAFDMATKDGDITKLLAGLKYDWLSKEHCKDIRYTLDNLPGRAPIPEQGVRFEYKHRRQLYLSGSGHSKGPAVMSLEGHTDMYYKDDNRMMVWELKNTKILYPQDFIQIAMYIWLTGAKTSGFLVSVPTGQTVEIRPKASDSLEKMCRILVEAKMGVKQRPLLSALSDEEFLAEAANGFPSVNKK
ncbi:hypothetical protein CAC42_4415 [Sphaceloma murrayae]|uniref:Uncharacterized protein n=1 Tax=Sphaceloma murrayae TaxID=2082308 RepID=A0A2K1QLI7_9PEZI|nr:hypothetical protein CAC42_4415 [Sphaceloma murrayae]